MLLCNWIPLWPFNYCGNSHKQSKKGERLTLDAAQWITYLLTYTLCFAALCGHIKIASDELSIITISRLYLLLEQYHNNMDCIYIAFLTSITFRHRRRCQPCKATASSLCHAQGHPDNKLGGDGDQTTNLLVTKQPALPPGPHAAHNSTLSHRTEVVKKEVGRVSQWLQRVRMRKREGRVIRLAWAIGRQSSQHELSAIFHPFTHGFVPREELANTLAHTFNYIL